MLVLLIIGAVYFFIARPDRRSGFRSDEGAGLPGDPAELPGGPALPAAAGTEPTAADPRP